MKRTAYIYAAFLGTKWGLTRSRKTAIHAVKENGSGWVHRMSLDLYHSGSWTPKWDAPTFRALSELIYTHP